jgi:hypothetical protein
MSDPFVDAIIQNESAGDTSATSPKGARGLMQIMPETAKDYGVDPSQLSDPAVNRDVGTRYFNDLLKKYDGNHRLALAAYNWGPGNIDRVGDNPRAWPKETRDYVPKVMADASNSFWGGATVEGGGDFWKDAKVVDEKPQPAGTLAKPRNVNFPARGTDPSKIEAQRKAVEGGGTDMSDPMVENATIGVMTAGLGSGIGFVPKTAAGRILNAGIGTAEQYLYGWTAEKAGNYATEKAAQSDNPTVKAAAPIIGAVAGFAAPMVVGGLESRLGSSAANLRSLPAAQEQAARTAADTAETKALEGAPKDIYEFGGDVSKAERAKADKMQGAYEKGVKEVQNIRDESIAQKGKALEAQAPAASQAAMGKFLGRTPAESQSVLEMTPEDYALHRANMRNVVFGPVNRIGEDLGKQFEVATEGKLNNPVENLDPLAKTIASEHEWLSERGKSVSKPIRDLLEQFPKPQTAEATQAQYADIMAGEGEKLSQARYTKLFDAWVRANPSKSIKSETNHQLVSMALAGNEDLPTIGKLLGWRTEATKLAASQTDHNQVVALQLRDAIDQTLMDSGVEIPKELREQWGTHKALFNSAFRRSVATAGNPADYGKSLFENPKRGLSIIRGATPDEKDSLKQLFADYVYSKRMSPMVLGKKVNPSVMKELFGDTPYANLKPWTESTPKALAWEAARAQSPDMRRISQMGFQRELQTITEEHAADVRKAGIKLAERLGPMGRSKLAKILAAKDPTEAARIVEQEFPINEQQAQQLYQQAQQVPAKQAFNAVREAKQIEKGLDINKVREDAAVQQLMQSANDPTVGMLKRRLFAWHLPMMIGGMAAGAAGGHSMGLGYQGAISGMILGMMGANKIRTMLRPALSTPEAAAQYWHAIEMAPNTLNAGRFGARMARVATAVAMRRMKEQDDKEQEAQP